MPDMVIDSQRQMQAACFCGVFPEIEHAWASVDNVLYIWDASRYRARSKPVDQILVEQDSVVPSANMCFRMSVPVKWQEEQAICCAGLTKPKPNVFQQAVQNVLVVCTTVEVGCCFIFVSCLVLGTLSSVQIAALRY